MLCKKFDLNQVNIFQNKLIGYIFNALKKRETKRKKRITN